MDRASKRAKKLEAMMAFQSNLPAHSQSALAAIVQRCKTHGIPECSSSKEQRHARLHLLEQSHGGGLGPLLQKGSLAMMDGTTRTVWYTSMLVLLCTMYRECPSFTALLQRRHAQKPSTSESPWSLQLYTDEVVPGNVLGRADRKFWTIYATIMEFDNHAQRENHGFHEQLWFTLCTIRSSIIMQADGGIAQVMAMILESIFCHDMIQLPHGGLLLKHPMGPQEDIRLHMTWNSMICDGAAHKAVWSTKGGSGSKFCMLCANATGHRPTLEQQQTMPEPLPDDELFIDTSCTTYSQLRLVSDQEILASYRRLAGRVGTCSKKEFQKWEQAIGVTFTKKALLTNEALLERSLLRPCSTFCHDYMHGVFQGTAVVVLHHVLQDVSEHLDVWQFLHGYMDHFIFPAAWKMTHLKVLFDEKRAIKGKSTQKFSCMASECAAIYGPIRQFVHSVLEPRNICPEACRAFLAMASFVDQVHEGVQHQATTRASLLRAAEQAISTFKSWNPCGMIRKWHWKLHLPDTLHRYGYLPSCFAAERKHKTISTHATKLQKTKEFELHLMQAIVPDELQALKEPNLFPAGIQFIKAKKAKATELKTMAGFLSSKPSEAHVASAARLPHGAQIHTHDVVVYSMDSQTWEVGQVLFHADVFNTQVSLIHAWDMLESRPNHRVAIYRPSGRHGFIPVQAIMFAVVFTKPEHGPAKVLMPYSMYSRAQFA